MRECRASLTDEERRKKRKKEKKKERKKEKYNFYHHPVLDVDNHFQSHLHVQCT